jgi:hypothetical protein
MSGWDSIGVVIAAAHLVMALLVAVSLPEASRRGSATAGTLYLMLALATIVWITRSTLWQQ